MIFKTFDNDIDKWTAKIGVFGKSFHSIKSQFEKVMDELIVTNDFTITNILNAWKNSNTKKDLSDKFIITQKDIQDNLKDLSIFDGFNEAKANSVLASLQGIQAKVNQRTMEWNDYFNGLKRDNEWHEHFVNSTNIQTASIQDVIKAQNAARDSAISYNNSLKQMTIGAKMGTIALKTLTIAANMALMIGINIAITEAIKLWDKLNVTQKEQREISENLKSEYQQITSDLKNLETQLSETGKRIDELNNKKNLSFIEKDELNNLEETNRALGIRIRLLEEQQKIADRESNESIKKEYNKQYGDESKSSEQLSFFQRLSNIAVSTLGTSYQNQLYKPFTGEEKVEKSIEKFKKLNREKEKGNSLTEKEQKEYDKLRNYLLDVAKEHYDFADRYSIDDETKKSWLDFAELIDKTINPELYKNDIFNSVFNSKDFEKQKNDLLELAKTGELSSNIIKSNKEYLSLWLATGLTANEVVEQINSLADSMEEQNNFESPLPPFFTDEQKQSLDSFQASVKNVKTALQDISSLDSSAILDLIKNNPDFDWDKFNVSGKEGTGDLVGALKALIQEQYNSLDASLQQNEGVKSLLNTTLEMADANDKLSKSLSDLDAGVKLQETVNNDIKELGYISGNTLDSIIAKYPELDVLVAEYNADLADTTNVLDSLKEAYNRDYNNYKEFVQSKLFFSEEFYKGVLNNLYNQVEESSEAYAIDFNQYKNLNDAKLALDKEHELKKLALLKAQSRLNDLLLANDDPLNPVDENALRMAKYLASTTEKNLKKVEETIKSINTASTIEFKKFNYKGLTPSSKDIGKGKKESSFSSQIDWASESINLLQNDYKNLENTLNNTTSIDKQISTYKKLIQTQGELRQAYKESAKLYKTQKENALKALNKDEYEKYLKLIESGKEFTIEDFSGIKADRREKVYNTVIEAKKYHDSYENIKQAAKEAGYEIKNLVREMANINWENAIKKNEKLASSIELLDAKYNNTTNIEKKNRILDDVLKKEEKSLQNYEDALNKIKEQANHTFSSIDELYKLNKNGIKIDFGTKISTKDIENQEQFNWIEEYNASLAIIKEKEQELELIREQLYTKQSETQEKKENNIVKFDWYENSINNLKYTVEEAQRALDNADGYHNQIDAIHQLTKAQDDLKAGYQSVANRWRDEYNNLTGIDEYKLLIESGIAFELEDFVGEEEIRQNIEKAMEFWRNWHDSMNSVSSTVDGIANSYERVNNIVQEAGNALVSLQSEIVSALKTKYQELYEARVKALKEETADTIAMHNSTIEWLRKEIERINGNTPEDKQRKLFGLEEQYQAWLLDDSTLGKSKQKELSDQIRELNKEISIDSLEAQIETEQKTIEELQKSLEEKLDKHSSQFDSILKNFDKNSKDLYDQASKMITGNKQQEIIDLLKGNGEDGYLNTIGALMGETAGVLIAKSVSNALSGLNIVLNGGYSGSNSGSNTTSTDSIRDIIHGTSMSANGDKIDGLSALNKYVVTELNGDVLTKKEMVALANQLGLDHITSIDQVGTDKDGRENKNKIKEALEHLNQTDKDKLKKASFSKGGYVEFDRTMVNQTGEHGIALVRRGEGIFTPDETNAMKSLVHGLPTLTDRIQKYLQEVNPSGSLLHYHNFLQNGYNPSKGNMITTNNSSTEFNKELVSVNIDKVINNTPFDIFNEEKNLNKMLERTLIKSGIARKI